MEIRKISVSKINPAPYNPRVKLMPGDEDYERIKASIESFGYVEPLIWNGQTGHLVGGHQRYSILLEMGCKEIEVSVVDLPLEKEKLLNLALNKVRGRWDEDKLAGLLQEIQAMPDVDINLTGFDLPEVSQLIDRVSPGKEDDFDLNKTLESIKEPVTKTGDLIQLGDHRLFCGDCSKAADVKTLMTADLAHLLFTDPPYNVDYYGGKRPHAKGRPKDCRHWKRIYSDNMDQCEYVAWLRSVLEGAAGFLGKGAAIYVWNGHRQFGPMHQIVTDLGFHVSAVITWAKPSFAISYGDYNQQTEFCLYGWKNDNGPHRWFGPKNESTLWEINRDAISNYIHPTQKPIALAQRALKNSSVRGDIVLDLFLGSGSTLIAAESLQRRCFGMEIDPRYCDAIVRRYIAFVGIDKVDPKIREKYLQEVKHG